MPAKPQTQYPLCQGLFLWGDLLGESPCAVFLRPRLPALLQIFPKLEARHFWPEPEGEPPDGTIIPLAGGRPDWGVRSKISPQERILIKTLVGQTAPLGSPVLAVASPTQDPTARIHADIPKAGPIYLVDPAEYHQDGSTLATQILSQENKRGHPSFVVNLVLPSPGEEILGGWEDEADRFRHALGGFLCQPSEDQPGQPHRIDLHFKAPEHFRPLPGAALSILRLNHFEAPLTPKELAAIQDADQLWVPSGFGRRFLEKMGVPHRKIHCIPPPLAPFQSSTPPTKGDTHPLALIDAMAKGLPLWLSPYGTAQDLVEHEGNCNIIPGRCFQSGKGKTRWLSPTGPSLETADRLQAIRHVQRHFTPERIRRLVQGAIQEPAPNPTSPLLRLEGPVFESSSYGRITRSFTRALRAQCPNLPIELHSRMDATSDPLRDADLLPLCIPSGQRPTHTLRSGWPVSFRIPDHGKWILRFDWEFGPPPLSLAGLFSGPTGSLHAPDQIWVHSQYVKDNLLAAGIPPERLHLVPHGIDPDCFFPRKTSHPKSKTTFLFVGGFAKRKGIDLLLQAWKNAFGPGDPVRLLLKASPTSAYRQNPCASQAQQASRDPSLAEIKIIQDDLNDEQMADLYRSADLLVHPYRGEGFGMPLLEAMACGLPIITTAGGASRDFVQELGSITISAKRMPCKIKEPCAGSPFWLEPQLEELTGALILGVQGLQTLQAEAYEVSQNIRATRSWAKVVQSCLPLLGLGKGQAISTQACPQRGTPILPGKISVT